MYEKYWISSNNYLEVTVYYDQFLYKIVFDRLFTFGNYKPLESYIEIKLDCALIAKTMKQSTLEYRS